MISYLIFGITYAFAAAVQPGPLLTYIISQTLKNGWRSTLPTAFAPLISDIPILIVVLYLLSTMPESFIILLRIGGGLFLFYLGFMAFKSWKVFDVSHAITNESAKQTLFNAIFVNLLNPAPYLGWSLIMGPLFLEGWNGAPINGLALIFGFYFTMILTLAGIIILFGFAQKFGSKVSRTLVGLSSIVLFGFGIYQLWVGISILVHG
ncbi:MAG: LysE family translocator [Calditrichaceae bacterium]